VSHLEKLIWCRDFTNFELSFDHVTLSATDDGAWLCLIGVHGSGTKRPMRIKWLWLIMMNQCER
jgi:hypothetical protein